MDLAENGTNRVTYWLRNRRGEFRRIRNVPLSDRGFRYGMAVFETIGVREGRAILRREHLQSCLAACVASNFCVDAKWFYDAAEFLDGILRTADCGVARVHVTAGDGAPADPATNCRMLVSYEARKPLSLALYARGYNLKSCPFPFVPTMDGRKTHNYWLNIRGLQSVKAKGGDEGLVFDVSGSLVSACMANVFIVDPKGMIFTPPTNCGARPGVIRQWVIGRGNVQEKVLKRNDVRQAKEVFITNSWLGIMRAAAIDGCAMRQKSVSKSLLADYHCKF